MLIGLEVTTSTAYSLCNLQERGQMLVGAGTKIYGGQIVGIHSRESDLVVNPGKGKKLTNVRASGSDDKIQLTPHRVMTLEDSLEFIGDDELVEVTPSAIRLRKRALDHNVRKRLSKRST